MHNLKNKKILIIAIIIVLVIAIFGLIFAFSLKTNNKEGFFKYFLQLFDDKQGFIDDSLNQYSEKKEKNSYDNEGKLTISSSVNDLDSQTVEKVNDGFYISFAGNIDNPNNIAEELIRINYSKNVSFPIYYKRVDDIKAVKIGKLVQRYIALNMNEIDEFISKFGLNINIQENNYSDIKTVLNNKIKNEYLDIIKNELSEDNFTKITKGDLQGYSLQISNENLKKIFIKLLENVKDDTELLDLFNLNQDSLGFLLDYLNDFDIENGKIIIDLYEDNGSLKQISIKYNDNIKIDITKIKNNDSLKYNISIISNLNENFELIIDLNYKGLNDLEKINSNHNIEINIGDRKYSYIIENEENFIPVSIQEFKENEYTNINNLSTENVIKLFELLGERFIEKNSKLIEQTGIDVQDYLVSILPIAIPEKKEFDESVFYEEKSNEKASDSSVENADTDTNKNEQSDLATSFAEVEKKSFNSKYEAFKGNDIKGSDVKQLIMNIIANNMADEERQIKVTGDIVLTGDEVPDGIETSKKYIVKLSYSNDGYVNEANIKENE